MTNEPGRESWEPMTITMLGHVQDIVQTGEGKLSSLTKGDSGEPNKKPPGEGAG